MCFLQCTSTGLHECSSACFCDTVLIVLCRAFPVIANAFNQQANPAMLEHVHLLQLTFAETGNRDLLQGLDTNHANFKEEAVKWLRPHFKRHDKDLQSHLQWVRKQQQSSDEEASDDANDDDDSGDDDDDTPLEDFAALDELLGFGSVPSATLCGEWSALDFAIDWAEEEAFAWLLKKDYVDVSQLSADHRTILNARASSNATTKKWGNACGTFLGRLAIEDDPKHVSATCCVVFAKALKAVDSFTVQPAGSASPSSRRL